MPIESKPNIQSYYIDGKEWDGNPGDIEPAEIETEPVAQTETPASIELTLPLTPEVVEHFNKIIARVDEAIKEISQRLEKAIKNISREVAEKSGFFIDRLLYEVNDNPRWWHLYKHAKKARTRKKYKRLLMKQLHSKLRPSVR